MAYGSFLDNINKEFEARFEKIEADFNFDYGPETEIAFCKALRLVLPSRFGVCRGFIVAADGSRAGDDIIVFERERFPALRLLDDDLSQKQRIPIDAVCAYIEAKNTLYVEGDGGQSLQKACKQIGDVKALPRKRVPLNTLSDDVVLQEGVLPVSRAYGWPNYRNPLFCAIMARGVAWHPKETATIQQIETRLQTFTQELTQQGKPMPDLIVAGPNLVCLPAIAGNIISPFLVENTSELTLATASGTGFGVAVCVLSWALDSIFLGSLDWPLLLAQGLDVPLDESPENKMKDGDTHR